MIPSQLPNGQQEHSSTEHADHDASFGQRLRVGSGDDFQLDDRPNHLEAADLIYLPTWSSNVYHASVIEVFAGWRDPASSSH